MHAIFSIGSNLGDRLAHLTQARDALARLPQTRLLACSRVYETEPMDVPTAIQNPDFLNAVVIVETSVEVHALALAMHNIEAQIGRTPSTFRNAPRVIDIDLIAGDVLALDEPDLQIPHPRAAIRRFVLEPLAELRPDLILPSQPRSIRELLAALPTSPRVKIAPEQWDPLRSCS
jgi:2-amino-4-hydroxy-6-hydroxymethyldihydropteridine diphosphokinase